LCPAPGGPIVAAPRIPRDTAQEVPVRPSVRRLVRCAAALAALAAFAPAAQAQSAWLDRSVPKSIHLELAKPGVEGLDEGFLTFAAFLTARLPLNDGLTFIGELPMATISSDDGDESSTTIGNPYVGIESRLAAESGTWFEFGARPPISSDDEFAWLIGALADADRWEAYFPNAIFIRGAGHWRSAPRDGRIGVDVRVAPTVWIPEEDGDSELFATYGVQALLTSPTARGGAGLTGRWLVTEDDGGFGERSTHQLDVAFDFLRGNVRPGVTLRVPLDDDGLFFGASESVIGLTLNFVLD
jgi:hypothetical protein